MTSPTAPLPEKLLAEIHARDCACVGKIRYLLGGPRLDSACYVLRGQLRAAIRVALLRSEADGVERAQETEAAGVPWSEREKIGPQLRAQVDALDKEGRR